MSAPHTAQSLPRGVLLASGALILVSIAFAALSSSTGVGRVEVPPSTPVSQFEVRFEDEMQAGLVVYTSERKTPLARVEPGRDGFVRGVLRSLNRTRKLEGLPGDAPFIMTRWEDGRLSLSDPSTNISVELQGFGIDNFRAFDRLMLLAEAQTP